MSVGDVLQTALRQGANRPAVVDVGRGRTWTYADLDRRAGRVLRLLRRHGVRRGDHVAWVAWNRGEFVEMLVACLRAGAALVPLNPGATPWERSRHLRLAQPTLIVDGVGDPSLRDRGGALVYLDDAASGYESSLAEASDDDGSGEVSADAIGAVLFTSGSTSSPRGARLSHRMLLTNAAASVEAWQFSPRTVTAVVSPLWHAGGFGAMLLPTLLAGGTVVVLSAFDPRTFWGTLSRHGATTMFGVPTLWQRALDAPGATDAASRGLRWLLCGGAPMPRRLHERYRAIGIPLRQGFGMTEAGINLCTPTARDAEQAPLAVGRPLRDIGLALMDGPAPQAPEAGEDGAGQAGELIVSGPCVASGYVGADDGDDDTFLPDGRVRTGDLVRLDETGRVWVVGRRKEVYTTSGFTVSPAEVELALHECADLEAAAVVPVPDVRRGEVGHAFVVASRARHLDAETLRVSLRARLSGYKVPARLHLVDDLPRTASGKIDRQALVTRARLGAVHC